MVYCHFDKGEVRFSLVQELNIENHPILSLASILRAECMCLPTFSRSNITDVTQEVLDVLSRSEVNDIAQAGPKPIQSRIAPEVIHLFIIEQG